jgi:hypothetical protein
VQILIDASNGASDYGNKFGEPLIAGYTRTFGLRMPSGERREWIKPIMFRFAGPSRMLHSVCLAGQDVDLRCSGRKMIRHMQHQYTSF